MSARTSHGVAARSGTPGILPGAGWRWTRRLLQALALLAILVAPLLGGWQRLDREEMAAWNSDGMELPLPVRDALPMGEAPRTAYESIQLVGGGSAVEYFGVPIMDPVAGTVALLAAGLTSKGALAIALPLLLAIFAGRVFCGWFCPFGTLSRALGSLLGRLPVRPPRLRLPSRRPVRWIVLGAAILSSLFGVHLLLYLALPHLLLQQSFYATWLLGGGGAVLGVLLGLLVAAAVFGPTTYCAAVCPTGAGLSLFARGRMVRLRIASPPSCGAHCDNCDRACWLSLDPASGDPGPDCDLCARCIDSCPQTNLRVGLGRGPRKDRAAVVAAALLSASVGLALPVGEAAAQSHAARKPELVLNGERVVDGVTVAVSVVDWTGVRLAADSDQELSGVELSVFVARGERGEPDERGIIPGRDVYGGPLTVRIAGERGRVRVEYDEPSSPVSAPRRAIFRRHLERRLEPGDTVEVQPIRGWLDEPVRWTVPSAGIAASGWVTLEYFGAALLIFMGLLSLSLAVAPSARRVRAPAAEGAGGEPAGHSERDGAEPASAVE